MPTPSTTAALQAAAKQFGFDGTDRSLEALLDAATCYMAKAHRVRFEVVAHEGAVRVLPDKFPNAMEPIAT